MPLQLKLVENVHSLVAGLHKGRAAARIFVCSQQKPWIEQVEGFSCLFCICLSSHPVNFGVEGMAVFATLSWPSQTSGRHPYLVPYPEERWNNLCKIKDWYLFEGLFVQIFNDLNQVTFDDETPERPPPPPPARLQSINTMKDFSGVSQAYNQVGLQFM